MKKVEKSSFAGTTDESSTNADSLQVCQPIAKPDVSSRFPSRNELRLGNYVQAFHPRKEVVQICDLSTTICKAGEYLNGYEEIGCIPLSKDWMLKLGFEAFPWGWVKKSKSDFGVRLNLLSFSYDVSGNYPVRLEFVHQLQNLFFVLTGEELEVVPNGC